MSISGCVTILCANFRLYKGTEGNQFAHRKTQRLRAEFADDGPAKPFSLEAGALAEIFEIAMAELVNAGAPGIDEHPCDITNEIPFSRDRVRSAYDPSDTQGPGRGS